MKSRWLGNALLFLLASLSVPTAYGQEKGVFYEVSGNGLAQPSYLFGTFHIVCHEDVRLSAATSKALADAKQLYLEIDFDDPSLQTDLIKSMMFGDGRTLKDVMKPEDFELLDDYLHRNGGPGVVPMAAFKPIALLSIVVKDILMCETDSFDLTLMTIALQADKEILGLESVGEQMAALDKIPVEDQARDLVEMIRQPAKAQKELSGLMDAYKAQDLSALMRRMRDSAFDSDFKFEDDLLNKRNANWIPVIEKAARAKTTFFAFGAAHLAGPKGVVNLLREKGYAVKSVQ
jgi:uncharacterized protein YbaP (TraB family)